MFGIRRHLVLFINLVNLIYCADTENLRTVLCADPGCSEPISAATGKITYSPPEKNVLGFKKGATITILGRSKEKNGYWVGKIENHVGFVPSTHIKEVTVWKSLDMLKYEVPISIENNIILPVNGNVNPGQDNIGTTPLPEFKADLSHGESAAIPLTNLIHGNIPNVSGEFLNQQVKSESEVPDANVKLNETIPDNIHTALPSDTAASNVDLHDQIGVNEISTNTTDNLIQEPLNANTVNSENLATPIETSATNEFNSDKSDVITNSNSNVENEVNSGEEKMNVTEKREVDSFVNDKKSNNENLEESVKENVLGSIFNSDEVSNEVNTISSNLRTRNDVDDVSVSSSDSSSFNVGSNEQARPKDEINNQQNLTENILKETTIDYTTASKIEEVTVLPESDKKSEVEKENLIVSRNIVSKDSTQNEGSLMQDDIQLYTGTVNQNANENKVRIEKTTTPDEVLVNDIAVEIDDNVNNSLSGNMPDNSSDSGIDSSSTSSAGSSSSDSSDSSSSTSTSSSGSSNSGSGIANFGVNTNDEKPTKNNFEFSGVTVEQIPKENIATHQDSGTVPRESNVPNSVDGINAWAAQFGHVPNLSGQFVEDNKRQSDVSDVEKTYVQPEGPNGADILQKPTSIPSQETVQVDIPKEETTEIFNNELPGQGHAPSVESKTQSMEDIVSDDVESSTPNPDYVEPYPAEVTDPESDITLENIDENGFFAKISNSILGWIGFGNKKKEEEKEIIVNEILNDEFFKDLSAEKISQESTGSLEGNCRTGLDVNCEDAGTEETTTAPWNFWSDSKNLNLTSSYNTLIYLIVTAVTVLLFTLGYYVIEKFQSDGPLIAKVNKLEQELLVSSKECLILKNELSGTKEKLNLFENSSNDKIITALQLELEESKKVRSVLENNIEVLQQELDAATEAGLDLNRMLSEVLTQKGGSETLMESVEHLQAQLNSQQKIIDEMTTKLIAKTKENQELQNELTAASEKVENLEGEIEDMRGNLNVHLKDNEDVISDLTSKNNELQMKIIQINEAKEKEILKLRKINGELEKKLKSVSDSLKVKVEECNNLKESVKKIKMKDSKNIDSLFEVSRTKAELAQSEAENSSLKERLKLEEGKLMQSEDKVKKMEEEIRKLKQSSTEAEKEKLEAQTRLEVLSNYFKEKETQLQKELGLREAMWVQKQGDDSTIYERMKSLEDEINSYKSQNEALKKEILDQERGLKAQITALEKKAHENWIAARQAERKLEETKQEGAQLRNKLTLMEKSLTNDLENSQHHRVSEELNGGDALSPLLHDTSSPILFPPPLPLDPNNTSLMPPGFIPPPMFMPPPPGGFMPPPPPFLPGDHRPPPLGRMSSPPLNNRFSPPPPDYAYDRMSTPPLSPSSRNYRSPNESDRERFRHRTPTSPSFRSRNWQESPTAGMSGFRPISSERDARRDHKGGSNLSSGHSSDSLDKSSRHSGRV